MHKSVYGQHGISAHIDAQSVWTCWKKYKKMLRSVSLRKQKLNSVVMQVGLLTFGKFQVQILVRKLIVLGGFLSSARKILGQKL